MIAINKQLAEVLNVRADGVVAIRPDGERLLGTFMDATHSEARRKAWNEAAEIEGKPIPQMLGEGYQVVAVALTAVEE